MDLSQYINFSVILDKTTGKMRLTDTSSYPAGVSPTVTGIFSVTQPDLITTSGSFNSPDVSWNGSQLTIAQKDLRLATTNSFQNGAYVITYTVRAAGYTDTVLQKAFTVNYQAPILVLTPNFDVFTPNLSVQDSTNYGQNGFNYVSTGWSWSALIHSVLGTDETVIGNTQNFNLAYNGNYYDSQYSVSLSVTPMWTLAAYPFVTIIDSLSTSAIYFAQIPPTLQTLLDELSALKIQVDAAVCNCATYSALRDMYLLGQAIFTHMKDRGAVGDLAGLSLYVFQLEKLFNNNVTPPYTNTNGVIPPYDWGAISPGSVTWASITGKPATVTFEWNVGIDGGFPAAGATILTDARLANVLVRVFRSGIRQKGSNPGDGSSYYTKNLADNFVTFFPVLTPTELICVETIPL